MRAYSDNEDLALLSGIDPERVVRVTWLIVAALAVVAGTLYGLDKSFKPFTYFQLLLPIFASAIVGGLGSPAGRHRGGLRHRLRGGDDHLSAQARAGLPAARGVGAGGVGAAPLSTDYKFAVSFVILLIVLLFRPTGLFAGRSV